MRLQFGGTQHFMNTQGLIFNVGQHQKHFQLTNLLLGVIGMLFVFHNKSHGVSSWSFGVVLYEIFTGIQFFEII